MLADARLLVLWAIAAVDEARVSRSDGPQAACDDVLLHPGVRDAAHCSSDLLCDCIYFDIPDIAVADNLMCPAPAQRAEHKGAIIHEGTGCLVKAQTWHIQTQYRSRNSLALLSLGNIFATASANCCTLLMASVIRWSQVQARCSTCRLSHAWRLWIPH